jgi:hypothetical protein
MKSHGWRSLLWIAVVLAVGGCTETTTRTQVAAPPAAPDPQLQSVQEQLAGVLRRQETSDSEQQRLRDTLVRELANSETRETADHNALVEVRRELERLSRERAGGAGNGPGAEVLRALQQRIDSLQREQAEYQASLHAVRDAQSALAVQLTALDATLNQLGDKIAGALSGSSSSIFDKVYKVFDKVFPVITAILGALVGYFGNRLLKRDDLTIDLIEGYLGAEFMGKYRKVLEWLRTPNAPQLAQENDQNDVLEVMGRFKFAKELHERGRLDKALFDAATIPREWDRFFKEVRAAVTNNTDWHEQVVAQLPPEYR